MQQIRFSTIISVRFFIIDGSLLNLYMADYSDDDLATRLKSGDAKAFDEIFGRYSRVMYVYAKNLVKDKDEAEELVQDIFTSLWDKAEKLELKSSLASYFV